MHFTDASSNLFTSVLYHLYMAPDGFCFDMYCGNQDLDDDPKSPYYNIDRRVCFILQFQKCHEFNIHILILLFNIYKKIILNCAGRTISEICE